MTVRLPQLTQPSQGAEQRFADLPAEGRPHKLDFPQCLMVAKKHMLAGARAAQLALEYGYTEKGMADVLAGPFMQALMAKLWGEWQSGAEEAAAIADAAAPVIMRRVVQRAMPTTHGGDDEWEAQKFSLTLTQPRRADTAPLAASAATADPIAINQIFVGLQEFKQLIGGGGPSPESLLASRLLHGTEGIDLAETVASYSGPATSAPDPAPNGAAGAPGEPAPA